MECTCVEQRTDNGQRSRDGRVASSLDEGVARVGSGEPEEHLTVVVLPARSGPRTR